MAERKTVLPKTQQARIEPAVKAAKTEQTLKAASVTDAERRMWPALSDDQRNRILELALPDRAAAIRRAYQKTRQVHGMLPGVERGSIPWEGPGVAEWVGVGAPDSVSGWSFPAGAEGEKAREHLMSTIPELTYERPGETERQGYLQSEEGYTEGLWPRGAASPTATITERPSFEASGRAMRTTMGEQELLLERQIEAERKRVTKELADMPFTEED